MCRPCVDFRNQVETDKRILQTIIDYKIENDGLAPTANIITKLAYVCKATVQESLTRLEKARKIQLTHRHLHGGIMVAGGQWTYEEPR